MKNLVMLAKPLLDLIGKYEADSAAPAQGVESGYDVVVWAAFQIYPPTKPISTMTIEEVLEWQKEAISAYRKKYMRSIGFSAAGRYQIVRSTLFTLVNKPHYMDSLFNSTVQDALAFKLLQRRGWYDWIAGNMSNSKFADAIAQEWASLPYNTGRSYYDSDSHGNRSLVSRIDVLTVLQQIRDEVNV